MEKGLVCFLVVGRMGKSLTYSKAEPFSIHPSIKQIYIFRENKAFPLAKTIYITLPRWILYIKPRFISRLIRLFAEPIQLVYHAVKTRPDIINGYHLIPKGINSLIAAHLSGSKCVLSIIGGIIEIETYSRLKWFLKRINLWALKKTDLITTKGSVVNAYLDRYNIPSFKILIYNGAINLDKFYLNPLIKKDIDIIFIGTFRHLKGPDRVLQIIASLKKDLPFIKACLIGHGDLFNSSVMLAEKLGIIENVFFAGYIDETESYYQRSKVFVLPSQSEGLPTSMLEAMACGCVPVISDVGNIKDVAKHGVNAFLIDDYKDIPSFVRHIQLLLTNEPLREEMIIQGAQTVQKNYSVSKQKTIVEQMINKLFPDYVDH